MIIKREWGDKEIFYGLGPSIWALEVANGLYRFLYEDGDKSPWFDGKIGGFTSCRLKNLKKVYPEAFI